MFWAAGAYNNGIMPFKHALLGEAYTQRRAASEPDRSGQADAGDDARPRHSRPAQPAAGMGGDAARRHLPRVRARRPRHRHPVPRHRPARFERRIFRRLEEPGGPTSASPTAVPAPGSGSPSPVLNITKTRLNDPFTWFMGTNDNPGDYRNSGCAACHVVYANNRDIEASGPYAKFGNRGTSASVDPTIPHDESGASAEARHDGRDPDRAVHDLPHASAEPLSQYLSRLHDVGLRDRGGADVADAAEAPDRSARARRPRPQSRRGGAARQLGRSRLQRRCERAQSRDQGYPVRRLSRPRLELPRRVQARPQGQPARRRQQHRPGQRSGKIQQGRAPGIRSMSSTACSASIATSRRTPTAAAISMARCRLRSRSPAPIATAPPRAIPTCARAAPPRRRVAPTCRCCAPPTGASASSGATTGSISARPSIPISNGR